MRIQIACTMLLALLATAPAQAQGEAAVGMIDKGPEQHLTYQSGDIQWSDAPASLEPGAQAAVLEGNPAEAGFFSMRLKMPDGYRIAPHWHPNPERLTVISGRFHLGSGEEMDEQAMEVLEAGAYTAMPSEMRHYARAEGETVVQLSSIGPWQINYVDSADDPRLREGADD